MFSAAALFLPPRRIGSLLRAVKNLWATKVQRYHTLSPRLRVGTAKEMANPQIVYNPGTGNVTLLFKYPPRSVSGFSMAAAAHDNISSAGVRERVIERIDNFLELEMPFVAVGADLSNWQTFLQFALAGGQFSYYADSSQSSFTNYWLDDAKETAAYRHPGIYSWKLKFRQVVT